MHPQQPRSDLGSLARAADRLPPLFTLVQTPEAKGLLLGTKEGEIIAFLPQWILQKLIADLAHLASSLRRPRIIRGRSIPRTNRNVRARDRVLIALREHTLDVSGVGMATLWEPWELPKT